MKSKTLLTLLLSVLCVIGFAAYAGSQGKTETKSVTGCLQKGDEPNEYSITDESGKLYGLRSSSVKLADHLGHRVTITGRIVGEKDEDEDEGGEGKSASKEAGVIQVTKLTMVSSSCQ